MNTYKYRGTVDAVGKKPIQTHRYYVTYGQAVAAAVRLAKRRRVVVRPWGIDAEAY